MHPRIGTPGIMFVSVALLIVARVVLLASHYEIHLAGDAFGYINSANYLMENGVLPPLTYQSKSFSVLLATAFLLCPENIECIRLIYIGMDAIIIAILSAIAYYFLKPHFSLALLVIFLLAAQPFTIVYANGIYPDHTCQFFSFAGAVLLYLGLFHYRTPTMAVTMAVLGGCFLGIAGLARQDMLPINLVVLAGLLGGAWLAEAKRRRQTGVAAALAAFVFLSLPAGYLSLQAYSSGELGFARPSVSHNPGVRYSGYTAWLRSWVAHERSEHNTFAWGIGEPDWPGFELQSYPDRAFGTAEQERAVGDLIARWREQGYTREVDQAFQAIARQRCARTLLYCELFLPGVRSLGLWFNLDGAQTIISLFGIERPLSTIVVGATLLLRLSFIFLAAGAAALLAARPHLLRDREKVVVTACLAALLLRTAEIGILGTSSSGISWAGLVEARYMTPVFPFLMTAGIIGLSNIVKIYQSRPQRWNRG